MNPLHEWLAEHVVVFSCQLSFRRSYTGFKTMFKQWLSYHQEHMVQWSVFWSPIHISILGLISNLGMINWPVVEQDTMLYPTTAAFFDRNWPAVYTIAIYGKLYMAEWRQRSTFLKCKWPPFFLDSKVWLMNYAFWLITIVVSLNLHYL